MPLSNAEFGYGVTLRRNGVEIAEVVDINPPGLTRETWEKTHHKSPNLWKEFGKGLKEAGEITFTINYIIGNATHNVATGILADFFNDDTIDTWDFVFPDAASTTWTFAGIVTQFNASTPRDNAIRAEITLKVSSQPTLV